MNKTTVDISIVVPVYGCPGALRELHRGIGDTLFDLGVSYEIVFVDDRCPMGSWEIVSDIARSDNRVIGVRLARNCGQQYAIVAGLDRARGDWVVVMDCDCQDPPEAIADLYRKAQEGYDIVFARRVKRKDTKATLALSHAFYRVYSYLAETDVDPAVGNFSIASRRALDAYLAMRERGRDYTLTLAWIGYERTSIDVEARERFEGRSSYSVGKKMSLAIETITSHSTKPLLLAVKFGFAMAIVGIIVLIWLVVQHFIDPGAPMGWPSTIATIVLVGGIIVAVMGVVGIYVGNTFAEAKHRPLYLVEDVVSSDDV